MNKIACSFKLFHLLLIVNIAYCSPKCYICDSKTDQNCMDPMKHHMVTKGCLPKNLADTKNILENAGFSDLAGYVDTQINKDDHMAPLNCIKIVAKDNNKEVIVRGCQLAIKEDLNVCKKLTDEKGDLIQHCSLCDKDGCNGASVKTISALIATIILPMLAFF